MRQAIDVANYTPLPEPAQIACLKQQGYERAIVGSSYGQLAHSQLMAFAAGGMEIEAYAWVTHPLNVVPLERALTAIEGLPVTRLWLDCEAATSRPAPLNLSDIREAIAYVRQVRPDLRLGIYTAAWWWKPNTGNSAETFGLPLWFANYRHPDPTKVDSLLFGGWRVEDVALWQYAGTIQTCGLNTDRNLILEAVEEEHMPTPEYDELFQRDEQIKTAIAVTRDQLAEKHKQDTEDLRGAIRYWTDEINKKHQALLDRLVALETDE